ncbi:hypothetical protein FKM82_009322 [Ascaphus truei]
MKSNLENIWSHVHPEVHLSYGHQYYQEYVTDMEKTFLSLCNMDLSSVTNCMEHALTAVHPQTRYSAGWDAKLFFIPISYVPTILADYLLTRTAPKPAKGAAH